MIEQTKKYKMIINGVAVTLKSYHKVPISCPAAFVYIHMITLHRLHILSDLLCLKWKKK